MANANLAAVSRVIPSRKAMSVRMMVGAAVLALCVTQAAAYTSDCSNPKRARTLATAIIALPDDDITKLKATFDTLSPRVGMGMWSVGVEDGGRIVKQTLGLQSPKVSVSITADWKLGQRNALLKVERTCITDDLEPWAGYWKKVRIELGQASYKLQ